MIESQSLTPVAAVYDRRLCVLCASVAKIRVDSRNSRKTTQNPQTCPKLPKASQACPRPSPREGGVELPSHPITGYVR